MHLLRVHALWQHISGHHVAARQLQRRGDRLFLALEHQHPVLELQFHQAVQLMLRYPRFQFSFSGFRLATLFVLRFLVACRNLFFQLRQFIL